MKSNPSWGFAQNPVTLGRFGELFSVLGHVTAVACAAFGLYVIVANSLDSAIYGVGLFGLGLALEVIVASRCNDKTARTRQVLHPRIMNIRKKKRRPVKR